MSCGYRLRQVSVALDEWVETTNEAQKRKKKTRAQLMYISKSISEVIWHE